MSPQNKCIRQTKMKLLKRSYKGPLVIIHISRDIKTYAIGFSDDPRFGRQYRMRS